jgi:hypothetical protein
VPDTQFCDWMRPNSVQESISAIEKYYWRSEINYGTPGECFGSELDRTYVMIQLIWIIFIKLDTQPQNCFGLLTIIDF